MVGPEFSEDGILSPPTLTVDRRGTWEWVLIIVSYEGTYQRYDVGEHRIDIIMVEALWACHSHMASATTVALAVKLRDNNSLFNI